MTVTCEGCGACCLGLPGGKPPLTPQEEGALPEALAGTVPKAHGDDSQACVWLDTGTMLCKQHDSGYKPQVCREMEVGGFICLQIRRAAPWVTPPARP